MSNLLLVEDDPTLALSLEVSLRARGHSVVVCRTLAQARRASSEQGFDLVLLDLGLPDGDGVVP